MLFMRLRVVCWALCGVGCKLVVCCRFVVYCVFVFCVLSVAVWCVYLWLCLWLVSVVVVCCCKVMFVVVGCLLIAVFGCRC